MLIHFFEYLSNQIEIDIMEQITYSSQVPEFASELCRTPLLQRLGKVGMNCGCEYTQFPLFRQLDSYSRLEHSIGVAKIIWKHTGDPAQTIAGLLHDIATPAFAHVIYFLNGDYIRQESTEDKTAALIHASEEIRNILSSYGIPVDAVTDYHQYPVADNDSPKLSADRMEYTLGNMVNYRFASQDTAQRLYDDIIAGQNEYGESELVFQHPDSALEFAALSLRCSEVYCSDADRYAMQILSEIIKSAVADGIIEMDDLYMDEPAVIIKLCSDETYSTRWQSYCSLDEIFHPDSDIPESRKVNAKRRCIDPYVTGQGRVSALYPEYRSALEEYLNRSLDYRIAARFKSPYLINMLVQ